MYNTAALGVVLDYKENKQSFFGGQNKGSQQHDDDILCVGISPCRKFAATGQCGIQPKIFVWETETGKVIAQYKLGKEARGIIACRFSVDGKYLAFVDNGDDHSLYVLQISDSTIKYTTKIGSSFITDVEWSKKDNDYTLCIVGINIIK